MKKIDHDPTGDRIDRRGFLKCMAWAGTGMLWTLTGGVLASRTLAEAAEGGHGGGFSFVQISDSHIGFNKPANPDVTGTLRTAVERINALPHRPEFVIHTGDLTHLSKPQEFDTLDQILRGVRTGRVCYVPGEHDVAADEGRAYLERHRQGSPGRGWYSFDHGGVHFVGLVNVLDLKAGGLGTLGAEQLAWLERDLKPRRSSQPVVVFAHVPLWSVYPQWGWGTEDAAQALGFLKRFGSVTVLNGHIHQVMQKVEGNVVFHTAMSTAFPQPAPGSAPSPGPMKVEAGRLREVLGITRVAYAPGHGPLAVADSALATAAHAETGPGAAVAIDNFRFAPVALTVKAGSEVTWTNRDDLPHTVVSTDGRFRSEALDTGEAFRHRFEAAGTYGYFCSLHPKMTGRVVVSPA